MCYFEPEDRGANIKETLIVVYLSDRHYQIVIVAFKMIYIPLIQGPYYMTANTDNKYTVCNFFINITKI